MTGTALRTALVVLLAVVVLTVGGCIAFGIGSSDEGDVDDLLTTPTRTTP